MKKTNKRAIIIGQNGCKWCREARKLLKQHRITYEYHDLDRDRDMQQWMRVEHIDTVPQIWLDGEHIGGYTELAKRLSK